MRLCSVLALSLLAAALPAQRGKPTIDWQKRATTIEHGIVPVGKHSLDELEVGSQWRLGMNEASFWTLAMPIQAGDAVLPPGQYRINLLRTDQARAAVVVQGTGLALGHGQDLQVPGEIAKCDKPAKKLSIGWSKRDAQAKDNLPVQLEVRFGDHQWTAPLTLLGGRTAALKGCQLTVFAVPAAAVEARAKRPVPVAVFTRSGGDNKAPDGWNLVLGGADARLVPWMAAPTDSFGFGEIDPPDAEWTAKGTVEAADAADGAQVEVLVLREATLEKGKLVVQLAAGKQVLKVAVAEPRAKSR